MFKAISSRLVLVFSVIAMVFGLITACNDSGDSIINIRSVGFNAPESVLYYEKQDVYLVSNLNGSPFDLDGNGFISKISTDGKVMDLQWISGGKNGVTLNSPKGMAIHGKTLFVADISQVRIFDLTEGTPIGNIIIPGSTFLNDVVVDEKNSKIYVSDTGFTEGFTPSGTDAIWEVDIGTVGLRPLVKDARLGAPNGLVIEEDYIRVVTFGSGEMIKIHKKDKTFEIKKAPKGSLDGIVSISDGNFLISSWDASAIYKVDQSGNFDPVIKNINSPADIGYDTQRKRVLIPLMNENAVMIHPY